MYGHFERDMQMNFKAEVNWLPHSFISIENEMQSTRSIRFEGIWKKRKQNKKEILSIIWLGRKVEEKESWRKVRENKHKLSLP